MCLTLIQFKITPLTPPIRPTPRRIKNLSLQNAAFQPLKCHL